MRYVLATFIALLIGSHYVKAQLVADAGSDKAYCTPYQADTPVLGGLIAAQGGIPPYTYHWTIRSTLNPGLSAALDEHYFLSNPNTARPKLSQFYQSRDSIIAVLQVIDSVNHTAYDTTIVYFQPQICILGHPHLYKGRADTIQFKNLDVMCPDRFGGYHDLLWMPSAFLDDSTKEYPRCFLPLGLKSYSMRWTNRVGCRVLAHEIDVEVRDLGLNQPDVALDDFAISIKEGSVFVNAGKLRLPAALRIYDVVGRCVLDVTVQTASNVLPFTTDVKPGLYSYLLLTADKDARRGRITTE